MIEPIFQGATATTGTHRAGRGVCSGLCSPVLDKMGHRVPDDVSVIALCPTDLAVNQRVRLDEHRPGCSQVIRYDPRSRWCFASSAVTSPPRPGWSRPCSSSAIVCAHRATTAIRA